MASTVPPVSSRPAPLSRGELSARDEENTVTSPPELVSVPLESSPSPVAASTRRVPPEMRSAGVPESVLVLMPSSSD